MTVPDPIEAVRRGYDAVSQLYRRDDDCPAQYAPWLATLQRRLTGSARVLDVGCGCGVPLARTLTDNGHHVTGIDLSEVQIDRARSLVPQAGLRVESEQFVPEADGGHQLFWAYKPVPRVAIHRPWRRG